MESQRWRQFDAADAGRRGPFIQERQTLAPGNQHQIVFEARQSGALRASIRVARAVRVKLLARGVGTPPGRSTLNTLDATLQIHLLENSEAEPIVDEEERLDDQEGKLLSTISEFAPFGGSVAPISRTDETSFP